MAGVFNNHDMANVHKKRKIPTLAAGLAEEGDAIETRTSTTVVKKITSNDDSHFFLNQYGGRILLKNAEIIRTVSLTEPRTAALTVIDREDSLAYKSDAVIAQNADIDRDDTDDEDDDNPREEHLNILKNNKYYAEYTKSNPSHLPCKDPNNLVMYNGRVMARYVTAS